MKQKLVKKSMLLYAGAAAVFFLASCADRFQGDYVWTSSVRNAQLESPAAEQISVRFVNTPQGYQQVISWPVVMGAGGYQVTVWNVDDPDNPVVIGQQDQVVDGLSIQRPATEDSRFRATVKALGNPDLNNTGATSAAELFYTNLLPVTAVIPNGSDLSVFFAQKSMEEWYEQNPVEELCFELEAGGNYTMSGNVRQGIRNVTIRGDKVNHPTVKMLDGSFVNSGAGFKLRFMDLDYSEFIGGSSTAIVLMDPIFNAAEQPLTAGGSLAISTSYPIMLDALVINDLKYYIFFDNSQLYAVGTMMIRDCVIGQNTSSFGQALIRFAIGMVKDFTITASTLYNEALVSANNNRFMQLSTNRQPSDHNPPGEVWAGASMTITNNTFWFAGKASQSFNANNQMNRSSDKITIQRNIFVDSYENGRIINRFRGNSANPIFTGGQNTQWYNGELFTGSQDSGSTGDVAYFTTDPKLEYLGNGQFRMTGAEQVAARTGDPRWLP